MFLKATTTNKRKIPQWWFMHFRQLNRPVRQTELLHVYKVSSACCRQGVQSLRAKTSSLKVFSTRQSGCPIPSLFEMQEQRFVHPLCILRTHTHSLTHTGRYSRAVYDGSQCGQPDSSRRKGECTAEQTHKAGPVMSNGCWAARLSRLCVRSL